MARGDRPPPFPPPSEPVNKSDHSEGRPPVDTFLAPRGLRSSRTSASPPPSPLRAAPLWGSACHASSRARIEGGEGGQPPLPRHAPLGLLKSSNCRGSLRYAPGCTRRGRGRPPHPPAPHLQCAAGRLAPAGRRVSRPERGAGVRFGAHMPRRCAAAQCPT